MLNSRVPFNTYLSTLIRVHISRHSSGMDKKEYQRYLQYKPNKDQIKTDQFRTFLPYIQERNEQSSTVQAGDTQDLKQEEPFSKELTNVTGKLSEIVAFQENKLGANNDLSDSPQGLVVMIMPTKRSPAPIHCADLSFAGLPLSLHLDSERSLVVAALVQDIRTAYFKTTETIFDWSLVAHRQGLLWYKLSEGVIRQQTLGDNSALLLCQKTAPEGPKKTAENAIDKGKQIVEKIVAAIKNKIAERKKSPEKKEPEKKEALKKI